MTPQKFKQFLTCLTVAVAMVSAVGVSPVYANSKSDSSKNEKHGDGGRAMQSAEKRIAELEAQLQNGSLSRKEKDKIKQTIKNIRQDAQKKAKGEEHGRRGR